jgi:PKD repeat protein
MEKMYRFVWFFVALVFSLGAHAQCFQTTPWTENFDGNQWQSASGFNDDGAIPTCWARANPNGNYLWMGGPPNFLNTNTGPSSDHTGGTGGYAVADTWFQFPSGVNTDITHLVTPKLILVNDTAPRVVFYYHMYGAQISSLQVWARKFGTTGWSIVDNIPVSTVSSQFTANTDPWVKRITSLTSYAGDTIQLRFSAKRTTSFGVGTTSRIAIDDVTVEETPSCDQPYNLSVGSVSPFSATIGWQSGNTSPLGYQMQYVLQGTAVSNGSIVNVTGNPGTISGLASNTIYSVRVREICAVGDTSAWSIPKNVRTTCSYFTAPYTENFDGSDWVVGTNFNDQGDLDPCWADIKSTNRFWNIGPPSFSWNQTGPSKDHTSGSGQYMFHQVTTTFGTTTVDPKLVSPWIDLDTLSEPQVSFWYHGHGTSMGDFKVYVQKLGGTWTALWDTSGSTQSTANEDWKEKILALGTSYERDTVRLRFDYELSNVNVLTRFAIDDVKIDRKPACPKPSNAVVNNTGIYVAQLGWTSGGASDFQIRYRAIGTTTWSWTTANAANKGIPGLTAQTTYQWQVRDSCSAGKVSEWIDGERFTTKCALKSAPYVMNFTSTTDWQVPGFPNQSGEIEDCWSRTDTVDYFWTGGNAAFNHYPSTGPSGDKTTGSGGYAFTRSSNPWTTPKSTFLTTPFIDMSTLQSPELTFWFHMFGQDVDKLEVFVKPFNSTAVRISTITGQQQATSAAAWKRRKLSLLAYQGDTVAVIFKATRKSGGGFVSYRSAIALDDVEIDEIAACPAPTVLSTNITYNSATINWNTKAVNAALEYADTSISQGSGTVVSASGGTYDLTNLLPNTTYNVWVQDSCTSTLTSPWTLHAFTTLPCPAITAQGSVILTSNNTVDATSTTTDADSVYWEWGDGNLSTDTVAQYTYTGSGVFDVLQIVVNSCGSRDTLIHTVSICGPISLVTSFTSAATTVDFDATGSLGAALTYTWEFGDGTTGNGIKTTHNYGASGDYTITLIAVDACGDTASTSFDITVCSTVLLSFNAVANGSTFDFTSSPQNLANYSWDFGDGNSGTGATASHTYAGNGTFTVSLTAEDSCGTVYTYSDDVATCDVPSGDFSFSIVSTSANGMVVDFQATATGASEFHWFWGDGNFDKGNTPNAQHTYGVITLNYLVRLLLINDCGDTTEIRHRLTEVGVEEQMLRANLYPIPVVNELTVDLTEPLTGTVTVLSTLGQMVAHVQVIDQKIVRLSLGELPAANYLVAIRTEDSYRYYRIVKI